VKEPNNYPVLEQVTLPDGSWAVLYDMAVVGSHVVKNLLCSEPDGTTRWTASPGEMGPDGFVSVQLDGQFVKANTWSGYAVWLEPISGKEVGRVFTK
jgi:hypothetical protein